MENKKILQLIIIFSLAIVFTPIVVEADCLAECLSMGYGEGGCVSEGSCTPEFFACDANCVSIWHDEPGGICFPGDVCCCLDFKSSGTSCSDLECSSVGSDYMLCHYECDGSGSCSNWTCPTDCVASGCCNEGCSGGSCKPNPDSMNCKEGEFCNKYCECEIPPPCSPCPNSDNTACVCLTDKCADKDGDGYEDDWVNYPAYGDCVVGAGGACECDTGVGSGQPCEPTITYNSSACPVACGSYGGQTQCEDANCCWCDYPSPSHCQNCPCGEAPTGDGAIEVSTDNVNWTSEHITVSVGQTVYWRVKPRDTWVCNPALWYPQAHYDGSWHGSTYTWCTPFNYIYRDVLGNIYKTETKLNCRCDRYAIYDGAKTFSAPTTWTIHGYITWTSCSGSCGSTLGATGLWCEDCQYATNAPGQWTDPQYITVTVVPNSPTVTTNDATNVEEAAATLNGALTNDGGESCSVRFNYGDTSSYGSNSGWQYGKTTGADFSANLSSLTKGKCYHFQAEAKNSNPTSGYSLDDKTFITKPDAPSDFSATVISGTQINLIWTKGTGAYYTMIRRKIGSYPTLVSDGVQAYYGTASSFSDTGLTTGETYYYRVWSQAYEEVGCGTPFSDNYVEDFTMLDITPPTVWIDGAPVGWQGESAIATVGCDDGTGSGCDTSTYRIKTFDINPGTCGSGAGISWAQSVHIYTLDTWIDPNEILGVDNNTYTVGEICSHPGGIVVDMGETFSNGTVHVNRHYAFDASSDFIIQLIIYVSSDRSYWTKIGTEEYGELSGRLAPLSDSDFSGSFSIEDARYVYISGAGECENDIYIDSIRIFRGESGLTSPQTIEEYKWVCGTAKDCIGNIGYSTPVEFKISRPPTVPQESLSYSLGCIWPLVKLNFTYNDLDGIVADPMFAYQIQIDDNNAFSNCETGKCLFDTGEETNIAGTLEEGSSIAASTDYTLSIGENLPVKTLYHWRVKVKDSNNTWSGGWIKGNFDLHPM